MCNDCLWIGKEHTFFPSSSFCHSTAKWLTYRIYKYFLIIPLLSGEPAFGTRFLVVKWCCQLINYQETTRFSYQILREKTFRLTIFLVRKCKYYICGNKGIVNYYEDQVWIYFSQKIGSNKILTFRLVVPASHSETLLITSLSKLFRSTDTTSICYFN